MTAAEPTPLEAAAEAMHDQRCSGDGACDHGGRFEQLAAVALTAGLAGDWLERVIAEHQRQLGPHGLTRWCTCGLNIGDVENLIAHQATAIRAAAGVGL